MKSRVITFSIMVAAVSFAIGLVGKLTGHHFFVSNSTWHEFAQTVLLFAIAWGVGELAFARRD
ncbi:MAG TPA: hypothetical protein VIS48_11310 [Candidatus Kryptonia bacterium]